MAIAPTAAAMTVFISLTVSQLRLFSAISGRQACPSWEMQLASRTGNGRIPAANIDTKTRCGPDRNHEHKPDVPLDPSLDVDIDGQYSE